MNNLIPVAEKKATFISILKSTLGTIKVACKLAGISRTMLYEYKKEDPGFAKQITEIEESAKDFVEGKLIELILKGDRAAIMFWLKAKAKDRGYR